MHILFADWHRLVEIDPTTEVVTARWAAIESLVSTNLTVQDAVRLVALAHADDRAGFGTEFATRFKDAEPTFPMIGNERLLAVLAGATLIQALTRRDAIADVLAYAVASTEPLAAQPTVRDVLSESSKYLAAEGVRLREPGERPAPPPAFSGQFKAVKEAIDVRVAANPQLTDHDALGRLVAQVITQVNTGLNAVAKHASEVAQWADASMQPLREELNMAWWLLSSRSRSTGAAWADIPPAAAAIVGARELADLVQLLPAPPVVDEFLGQLLEVACAADSQAATLADAVAGLPAGTSVPQAPAIVAHLTPVTAAAAGAQASADCADEAAPALRWAQRAFTEAMLIRAVEAAE